MVAKDATSHVEGNPFVQHAQMDLSGPRTARQALASLVTTVWDKPLNSIPTSELSFAGLISSPIMAPFWSAPFCHPWRPPFWTWEDDAYWYPVGSQKTPTEIIQTVEPLKMSPAAFQLEATPGMRLADRVRDRFGSFRAQGVEIFFPNQSSPFFYATFKVGRVNRERRLAFAEFRTISIEIENPTHRTLATLRYNLLALVKHAGEGDGDTIRVYNSSGSAKDPQSPDYASPTWQMADLENGDTFFAVYAKSVFLPRLDPPFPEIAASKESHLFRRSQKRIMITELFTSMLHGYSDSGSDEDPDETMDEIPDKSPDKSQDEIPGREPDEIPAVITAEIPATSTPSNHVKMPSSVQIIRDLAPRQPPASWSAIPRFATPTPSSRRQNGRWERKALDPTGSAMRK